MKLLELSGHGLFWLSGVVAAVFLSHDALLHQVLLNLILGMASTTTHFSVVDFNLVLAKAVLIEYCLCCIKTYLSVCIELLVLLRAYIVNIILMDFVRYVG